MNSTHDNAGRIPRGSEDRVIHFGTLQEKARWLDSAASLDSLRKGLLQAAERFTGMQDPEDRARHIQRFVRDHFRYVQDFRVSQGMRGEEFADSESILKRGYDDCDGKSRLYVALVRAAEMAKPVGLEVAIRPVFQKHPLEFVHVQAVTRWPGSKGLAYADRAGWVLTELILKGCEMGQDPDDCPRGPHGDRVYA